MEIGKTRFMLLVLLMAASFAFAANGVPVITSLTAVYSGVAATSPFSIHAYAYDPGGENVTFTINWGDGSSSSGTLNYFSHAYALAGTYTITATASNSQGTSQQESMQAVIAPAPAPICPGYPELRMDNNLNSLTAGPYVLRLDSVDILGEKADYTLLHGQNVMDTLQGVPSNSTQYFNVPNGDVLKIEVCRSFGGFTMQSMESHVSFSIVSGPSLLSLPPIQQQPEIQPSDEANNTTSDASSEQEVQQSETQSDGQGNNTTGSASSQPEVQGLPGPAAAIHTNITTGASIAQPPAQLPAQGGLLSILESIWAGFVGFLNNI